MGRYDKSTLYFKFNLILKQASNFVSEFFF